MAAWLKCAKALNSSASNGARLLIGRISPAFERSSYIRLIPASDIRPCVDSDYWQWHHPIPKCLWQAVEVKFVAETPRT